MAAESIHGTIRQMFIAPAIGDLAARQLGVVVGSGLVFVVAWACIRWINARSFPEQLRVGLFWVALTLIFEVGLGTALGYSWARILSDYSVAKGGFMGFGLLFMALVPTLAARARGLDTDDNAD